MTEERNGAEDREKAGSDQEQASGMFPFSEKMMRMMEACGCRPDSMGGMMSACCGTSAKKEKV